MPASEGDFIIVHMVDQVEIDQRFERRRLSWPLHITLVPWFKVIDAGPLMLAVESATVHYEPFEYEVGGIEAFGARRDVPVNLVSAGPALRHLHEDIIKALGKVGAAIHNTESLGGNYRPHITRHEPDNHYAAEGELRPFENIHVVELQAGNICEVKHQFQLGYTT